MNFRGRMGFLSAVLVAICGSATSLDGEEAGPRPLAGADELTPSRSHYFSWIDNTGLSGQSVGNRQWPSGL
jgi:hypothetical protein